MGTSNTSAPPGCFSSQVWRTSKHGGQLIASYRHAGKMNATMWDGHGETLTKQQSRNPTLWYPSGYRFTNVTAHADAAGFYPNWSNTPGGAPIN